MAPLHNPDPAVYREDLVYLDAYEDMSDPIVRHAFPCLIPKVSTGWNGWAEPLFTTEVAKQVVDLHTATRNDLLAEGNGPDVMDEMVFEGHEIVVRDWSDLDGAGKPAEHRIEAGDDCLYGIGTGAWCWSHPQPGELEADRPKLDAIDTAAPSASLPAGKAAPPLR